MAKCAFFGVARQWAPTGAQVGTGKKKNGKKGDKLLLERRALQGHILPGAGVDERNDRDDCQRTLWVWNKATRSATQWRPSHDAGARGSTRVVRVKVLLEEAIEKLAVGQRGAELEKLNVACEETKGAGGKVEATDAIPAHDHPDTFAFSATRARLLPALACCGAPVAYFFALTLASTTAAATSSRNLSTMWSSDCASVTDSCRLWVDGFRA